MLDLKPLRFFLRLRASCFPIHPSLRLISNLEQHSTLGHFVTVLADSQRQLVSGCFESHFEPIRCSLELTADFHSENVVFLNPYFKRRLRSGNQINNPPVAWS